MSYTLAAVHPGHIEAIRELVPSESGEYLAAVNHLRDHSTGGALLEMARRNFQEFEAGVASAGSNIPAPGQRGILQRELSLDLNRRLLNFLTSFRQFLDHTEARLKHQYADEPTVYAAFKARTAKAHDQHFAYRFFYRLRNFGQHLGIPIGFVDIESKALERSPGIVLHQVHLKFDREQLLAGGDAVWGKAGIRTELTGMPSHFPVETYARIVMTELTGIWDVTRSAERLTLEARASRIVALTAAAHHARITPAVVRPFRKGGQQSFEFFLPPIEVMTWLGHAQFREFL